jgi:hypothetical protein
MNTILLYYFFSMSIDNVLDYKHAKYIFMVVGSESILFCLFLYALRDRSLSLSSTPDGGVFLGLHIKYTAAKNINDIMM